MKLVGAVVVVLALVIAAGLSLTPLKAEGTDCGSVAKPEREELLLVPVMERYEAATRNADCARARDDRRAVAGWVSIVGVVAGVGVILLAHKREEAAPLTG